MKAGKYQMLQQDPKKSGFQMFLEFEWLELGSPPYSENSNLFRFLTLVINPFSFFPGSLYQDYQKSRDHA